MTEFDTLTFGYLELKWKRLARVLSIGFLLTVPLWIFVETVDEIDFDSGIENFLYFIFLLTVTALLIGLISWMLKPFIVKD